MKFNFQANYNTEIIFEKFEQPDSNAVIFADEFFRGKFDGQGAYYLSSGEKIKSKQYLLEIIELCESKKIKKSDHIIVIGGGAILDFIGFVASILHRGIKLTYVPTTLLAMVDSCLGGKTGINTDLGKNTIGSFYPAQNIIIDERFLKTLPANEISSGMAEVIKYELITGCDLIDLPKAEMVKKCLNIKAEFCEDLLDKNKRKILNYGHTYGHALEALKPGEYSHGQAVAFGMIFVAKLTNNLKLLNLTKQKINKCGLSFDIPNLDAKLVLKQMKMDKKNLSAKITFVVLEKNGTPVLQEFEDNKILNIS